MTTTLCPDAVALHSETGETWFDPQAADQSRPLTWEPSDAVTKIVIGTPPTGDEKKEIAITLPDNLGDLYPNLTHLHLWQISNLKQLPELPSGMKCIDLRGCKRLIHLPELSDSLEDLDLGGCVALTNLPNATPALLRLSLNDCSAVEEDLLHLFWRDLARCRPEPRLIEFDGSRCPAVSSIKRIPRSVARLVLEGCENLRDVKDLHEFGKLGHLNLSACPNLEEIPSIPDRLQYVQLYGSELLNRFMGQDIGPYDRGTEEEPNVAKTLYSRRKFGSELSASAHAKLLLLGDGRVGKTTLAKRLQWDCMSSKEQRDPQFAHLRPRENEKFTHKVSFSLWKTRLQFDEESAVALNERAASAGLSEPCDEDHCLDGSIRIWDFGGQEIYHQTHRLFAGEGSVFLILWMEKEIKREKLLAEKPRHSGISDEEWEEWNRMRSLDYWLDYVHSIRPSTTVPPRIALVCTRVPRGHSHPPWTDRAPKHGIDDLPCFYLDSLDDACPENPEYRKLVDFIRGACGAEANRIGIVQPTYYSEVATYVDGLLAENDAARRDPDPMKQPEHRLVLQADWNTELIRLHAQSGRSQHQLDSDDVNAITGYLHDAGQIFHLRDPAGPAVLIDQEWATDLIYKLLQPPPQDGDFSIFSVIRAQGGYFDASVLEEDEQWKTLGSDVERQQLLAFMQQCGIIVRLLGRDDSRDHRDHYLATEKWLLPEFDGHLERDCEVRFQHVLSRSGGSKVEKFPFDHIQISEFEFRSLMAHLGGVLGTRGTWFRNGMQAVDDRQDPSWCFEVHWRPDDAGFLGTAKARLTTTRRNVAWLTKKVEEVFAADGSPFAKSMKRLRRETIQPDEMAHIFFRDVKDSDFDVAVSSSGADRAIVEPLVTALKDDGLRVTWYRLPECRLGENIKVMKFMEELRNPPCILLFLSDAYLRNDPENNWYCVWELADALLRLKAGARSVQQTLVAYAQGGTLTSMNLDRVAADVLKSMAKYFRDLYHDLVGKDRSNRKTFEYYSNWSNRFDDAADYMGEFHKERGTLGTYSQYEQRDNGQYDFSAIVRDVRQALDAEKGGHKQ